MNEQQTYRRSSFHVGWMRGTLVYNNPLTTAPVNYGCRQGQLQIIKSIEMVIIMFMLIHILHSDVLNGMYLKAMFHIDPCIMENHEVHTNPWG